MEVDSKGTFIYGVFQLMGTLIYYTSHMATDIGRKSGENITV